MSILNDKPENKLSPLMALELALKHETVNGKKKKDADFREAYLLIERHLANRVSQKVILDQFNAAYGYTLHPPRFRKMLLDERARRAETGDFVVCDVCGQRLPCDEIVAEDMTGREGQ